MSARSSGAAAAGPAPDEARVQALEERRAAIAHENTGGEQDPRAEVTEQRNPLFRHCLRLDLSDHHREGQRDHPTSPAFSDMNRVGPKCVGVLPGVDFVQVHGRDHIVS